MSVRRHARLRSGRPSSRSTRTRDYVDGRPCWGDVDPVVVSEVLNDLAWVTGKVG